MLGGVAQLAIQGAIIKTSHILVDLIGFPRAFGASHGGITLGGYATLSAGHPDHDAQQRQNDTADDGPCHDFKPLRKKTPEITAHHVAARSTPAGTGAPRPVTSVPTAQFNVTTSAGTIRAM